MNDESLYLYKDIKGIENQIRPIVFNLELIKIVGDRSYVKSAVSIFVLLSIKLAYFLLVECIKKTINYGI